MATGIGARRSNKAAEVIIMFNVLRRKFCAALILCLIISLLPTVEASDIVIFHTNDQHARVAPDDDNGKTIGLAYFSAAVKAVKAENPNTLWLDAGDTFHGTPRINISKGMNMVELINAAGIDVVVPGNHDFNYGSKRLEQLAKAFKGTVLGDNVVRRKNQKSVFKSYKIFKTKDGLKIGVFGVTTPECAYKTSPANVATLDFVDPIVRSKMMIAKLRPQVDLVIAVMHMGVDASSEFTSERIARETDGIDVIIDGHSHTEFPEGLFVGKTLIAQTGCHEHFLGRVDVTFDNSRRITSKTAKLLDENAVKALAPKPDPLIESTLADIEVRNQKLFGEVIAQSERHLTGDRLVVRRGESEFGNLIADAFRWKTKCDIAIINGGDIRTDLPSGSVTRGDLLSIFPFNNAVQVHEISGRAVREMLEHSVYAYPASFGGFLNVSGMTFEFDPTAPVGKRVGDIFVNGNRLENTATYTIAATDFAFSGGDGYDMLAGLKMVGQYDMVEDIVAEYLNEVGMPDIGLGRITVLKDVPMPEEQPVGATEYKEAA